MKQTEIHIAFSVNDNYVLPLLVMLTSLQEHLCSGLRPIFHLPYCSLSEQSLAAITGTVVECRPLRFSASVLERLPRHHNYPPESACPLFLAELLSDDVTRLIYLDADLLVLDDLAELWNTDLDGHVLAAAVDDAVERCGARRGVKDRAMYGFPEDALYFNCGVLLIDLEAWRRRDVTRQALDYLGALGSRVDLLHQEALNAVLWDDWQALSPRWNLLASIAGRSARRHSCSAHPGIVHFSGRMTPWRQPVGGPFNAAYQAVLAQVRHLVPQPRGSRGEWLLSFYDRRLRDWLYPLERFLWKRRIL